MVVKNVFHLSGMIKKMVKSDFDELVKSSFEALDG
jgi:hypothetical protein